MFFCFAALYSHRIVNETSPMMYRGGRKYYGGHGRVTYDAILESKV